MARMTAKQKAARKRSYGRRKKALNLFTAAETLVNGSILTRWAFNTDLIPFLTEGWLLDPSDTNLDVFGGGGSQHSSGLSLSEIIKGVIPGGAGSGINQKGGWTKGMNVWDMIMRNMRRNAGPAIAAQVTSIIGFRIARKVSGKTRRQINAGLKQIGLEKDVKV